MTVLTASSGMSMPWGLWHAHIGYVLDPVLLVKSYGVFVTAITLRLVNEASIPNDLWRVWPRQDLAACLC